MNCCRRSFGKALRAIRTGHKLTQEELVFASGIDRGNISLIERGVVSPTIDTVCCLCAALNCRFMDIARLTQTFIDETL